jgi:hypothetical protein
MRGGGLPHDGGKMGRMRRKLRPLTSFIGAEERGERTAVPHVSDDTPAANRSGRDVARRSGPLPRSAPRAARSV